jgi:hypothetical protein
VLRRFHAAAQVRMHADDADLQGARDLAEFVHPRRRQAELGGLAAGVDLLVVAVAMAQVLPISIGGLGLREGALVLFLHPLGVSYDHAIAFGLLIYGMNLLVSLLGAPAFAGAMGDPEAVPVVRLLTLAVVVSGLVATPVAMLQR